MFKFAQMLLFSFIAQFIFNNASHVFHAMYLVAVVNLLNASVEEIPTNVKEYITKDTYISTHKLLIANKYMPFLREHTNTPTINTCHSLESTLTHQQ